MRVVVLGPQRSGTNYIESLLKNNFEEINVQNQDSKYIWKHRAFPQDVKDKLTKDVKHFVVHKNPYKWVESIMRYNADLEKRFGGTAGQYSDKYKDQQPGDIIVKDKRNKQTNIGGACRLYNDFYNGWIGNEFVDIILVRYEDLLIKSSREQWLQMLVDNHKFKARPKGGWNNPDKVGQSDKWNDKRTENYLNLQNFAKLDQAHLDLINKYIEKKWFDQFKYPIVTTKGWNIDQRKR